MKADLLGSQASWSMRKRKAGSIDDCKTPLWDRHLSGSYDWLETSPTGFRMHSQSNLLCFPILWTERITGTGTDAEEILKGNLNARQRLIARLAWLTLFHECPVGHKTADTRRHLHLRLPCAAHEPHLA